MKNKERYKDELNAQRICSHKSPWRKDICEGKECYGCALRFLEWCEREAITEQEKDFLKMISTEFKYIARDEDGKLFVYCRKPEKSSLSWISTYPYTLLPLTGLFDWIRFEDEKPWRIDDFVKRPALDSNTRPRDEEAEEEDW